jgi:hypothetical protein
MDCPNKDIIDSLKIIYRPKDCFLGDLSGHQVFIVDLSGSMNYRFTQNNKKITRLYFLKTLLKKAIESLKPNQTFQIILFNSRAKYIYGSYNSMFPATAIYKNYLIQQVNKLRVGLGKDRYTNISEALMYAFKIKRKVDRILMFTDGGPTMGITTTSGLEKHLNKLIDEREKMGYSVPVVDIVLLALGGEESERFRANAKLFTDLIAKTTYGIVKNFDKKDIKKNVKLIS